MSTIAVPQNIYNAVAPVARQYGVPDSVWEDVAYQESGFNPKAVGDNGTSFGLFQLHEGGQLPQQYYNDPQAVFDPALNARLAMPAIARGYQQSGQVNTSSLTWWERFGAISGHPGGPAGSPVNANLAQKLLKGFPSFGGQSGTMPASQLLTDQNQQGGDCCKGDFGCEVCMNISAAMGNPGTICCPGVAAEGAQGASQDVQQAIASAFGSAISSLFNSLKPEFIKVGVFLLGLALFLVGWWILLHPPGGG